MLALGSKSGDGNGWWQAPVARPLDDRASNKGTGPSFKGTKRGQAEI